MESRKNRLKNEKFDPKTPEIRQNSGDSAPILTPDGASEAFGQATTAFLEEFSALTVKHGIEGVILVTLHEGLIRTASTGVHPHAREHAKQLALQIADALSRLTQLTQEL
jgi:hypothetical protein